MQIYLDEVLARQLEAVAARTGKAEEVLVRAALRAYLEGQQADERKRDPLLELVGLVDATEGPRDVAIEHDRYVYGVAKRKR